MCGHMNPELRERMVREAVGEMQNWIRAQLQKVLIRDVKPGAKFALAVREQQPSG